MRTFLFFALAALVVSAFAAPPTPTVCPDSPVKMRIMMRNVPDAGEACGSRVYDAGCISAYPELDGSYIGVVTIDARSSAYTVWHEVVEHGLRGCIHRVKHVDGYHLSASYAEEFADLREREWRPGHEFSIGER